MDVRVLIMISVALFASILIIMFTGIQDAGNDTGNEFIELPFETKTMLDSTPPENLLDPFDNSKQTNSNLKPKYVHTIKLTTIGDRTDNGSRDIVIDSENFLYISNGNNSVEKYGSDGTLLLVFGNATVTYDRNLRINPEHQIDPRGLDVGSDGTLYVLDFKRNWVHHFDVNGTSLGSWEVFEDPGKKPAQYWNLSELSFDSDRQFLYVADGTHNNIQILDKQGNLIDRFGSGGLSPGQFNWPAKIAFDDNGYLHVVNKGKDRIQIFDENLEFVSEKRGFTELRDIAFDSDGNIYVLENSGTYIGLIKKFDSQWNSQFILTTRDFTDRYIPFEKYDVGFENIVALDIGPDDHLYVLDRDQGVHVFAP